MKRLLVDVSSICWTSLYAGKDEENFRDVELNGRTVRINSWQHGYENAINSLVSAWEKNGIRPCDTILVKETGNSTGLRKRILPSYKEKRDANRPKEYYEEFNALQDKLVTELAKVGASTVTLPHAEADDVIAYLAVKLQGKKVIWSRDKDLAALISEDVSLWADNDLITDNPYGPWPVEWIPVYKGLVGDSSDKIPGAKGFGDKAWLNLISIFGAEAIPTVENLIQTKTLDELQENVADLKVLGKVLEHQEDVYKSYAAGKLYPDQCENMRQPLQWSPSYVHPRSEIEDERLRPYGGVNRVVHAGNFDEALEFLKEKMPESQFVSLDLETSTSPESDDWLYEMGNPDGVDVHDSKITGMGLTFGFNQNMNLYFSVDHKETEATQNITLEQLREVIEAVGEEKLKVIANFSGFEAIVLRKNLGDLQGHFFLPNVVDVQLESAYVDENQRRGLKHLTNHYFGVDQLDYKTVTQGRKMNQMTAEETLEYGAGDTLFTSALHKHFRIIMEIEGTTEGFQKSEIDAQYLLAHTYLNGVNFDFGRLLEIEKEDIETEAKSQEVLDQFLINVGWEGTVCPEYKAEDLENPAKIKEIYKVITGEDFKTMVRTPSKLYKLMATLDNEDAPLLAKFLEEGNLDQINDWVQSRFDGSPEFNTGSPKQVKDFLYDTLKLPVRLVNKLTDNERNNKPELASAVWQFNKIQSGSEDTKPLTKEQEVLLVQKATTDSDAIEFALKYDVEGKPEVREVLEAFKTIKEIETRKKLFYAPWKNLLYWKDRKMYPYIGQSNTTSLRFTASKPNVTQLAKRGEGVKMRSCFVPHHKKAVIVSLDQNAQELRFQAALSNDPAFLACYVGDNKKDVHSLTGAAIEGITYEEFMRRRQSDDPEESKSARIVRDEKAKPTNFLSAYGGTEFALHRDLVIPMPEAKTFLDAKRETFPRYEEYQAEVQEFAKSKGYVDVPGGSRRHVGHIMRDGSSWERDAAARSAGNAPIQGGSAHQIKRAMGAMWRSGMFEKFDVNFYMPVHDEIVLSVHIDDAFEVIRMCHEFMTEPFFEHVPAVSSISVGLNYGDLHEIEEEFFDGETLSKILDDLRQEMQASYTEVENV